VSYSPVNVGDLEKFDSGARVDETALRAIGLANGKSAGIKILGNGELSKKLSVSASAFSASAKAKIEARGGTVEIVGRKPAEPAKA
jgi:large subunit ribosomal protein L15